jgi:hypothetical protein
MDPFKKPSKYLLKTLARERGMRNEQRVLFACQNPNRPAWMLEARLSTKEEDRDGIDIVITSDIGKLFVQVKSSTRGRELFTARRRRARVAIVIAHHDDTETDLLHKVVSELTQLRKQFRRTE